MTLSHIHLQLTRACNLACRFCGQNHAAESDPLTRAEWAGIIDRAAALVPRPKLTLWGGEPLLSADFTALATRAAEAGLELELITNGTLLDRCPELLKRAFRRIYVSVDGPEAVHDAIRGAGVFARVRWNLGLIAGGDAEIILMGVLAPRTLATAQLAPYGLPVDRIIFHELIYLAPEEAPGCGDGWRANYDPAYPARLAETLACLRQTVFPTPAEFQPHSAAGSCREPMRHLHISSVGECGFCTDFTDYTLGNVRNQSLEEIFHGAAAEAKRREIATGNFPYCRHCSWKNTLTTVEHFPDRKQTEERKKPCIQSSPPPPEPIAFPFRFETRTSTVQEKS